MARIDPTRLPVVADLERGLRELGVPFGVVGALVPELLLDARPARMTNDADVMVVVQTVAEFDGLKDRLAGYGFERTRLAHRLRHASGGVLDLLPYSASIAPGERLQLDDDTVFNMAGFRSVVPHAVSIAIEGGPSLPLAPLPLYVLPTRCRVCSRGSTLRTLNSWASPRPNGEGPSWMTNCARMCSSCSAGIGVGWASRRTPGARSV
jgi:hypothetical protein